MNVDKALANCKSHKDLQSGDTGRRRVEHRNFLQLKFAQYFVRDGLEVFMRTVLKYLLPFNIFL